MPNGSPIDPNFAKAYHRLLQNNTDFDVVATCFRKNAEKDRKEIKDLKQVNNLNMQKLQSMEAEITRLREYKEQNERDHTVQLVILVNKHKFEMQAMSHKYERKIDELESNIKHSNDMHGAEIDAMINEHKLRLDQQRNSLILLQQMEVNKVKDECKVELNNQVQKHDNEIKELHEIKHRQSKEIKQLNESVSNLTSKCKDHKEQQDFSTQTIAELEKKNAELGEDKTYYKKRLKQVKSRDFGERFKDLIMPNSDDGTDTDQL